MTPPLLSILVFLPLTGAVLLWLLPARAARLVTVNVPKPNAPASWS